MPEQFRTITQIAELVPALRPRCYDASSAEDFNRALADAIADYRAVTPGSAALFEKRRFACRPV